MKYCNTSRNGFFLPSFIFFGVDERGHSYISEGQVFGTNSCFLIQFFFSIANEKKSQLMIKKPKKTRKGEYFLSLNTVVYLFSDGK